MRRAALISATVVLVMLIGGCRAKRSEDQVRTLTETFFSALQQGDIPVAQGLVDGSGGEIRPLITAAGEQVGLIPSFSIKRIHRVDGRTERVLVEISGTDATTTIALVARRVGESWRFDSDIQVETRVDTIGSADGPSGDTPTR